MRAIAPMCIRAFALATIIVLAACGSGEGEPLSDEDGEKRYDPLTIKFGQHVMREEWPAAYAMLSEALRDHFTQQEFADAIAAQNEEYHADGLPIDVGADYNTFDPSWITREDYDIPRHVPDEPKWLACTFANMVLEGTADAPERCYHLSLIWVREEGADRICHFEHGWCD